MNEQCYINSKDYDPFFKSSKIGAKACPESLGKDQCVKVLTSDTSKKGEMNQGKKGQFTSGITGYGIGYFGVSETKSGRASLERHGIGANMSLSHKSLLWGIPNLSLSADVHLGFGNGVQAGLGVGPIFSFGVPGIARGWGSLKARGSVSSDGEGNGNTSFGMNPEAGFSLFFLDFRYVFPEIAGIGEVELGDGFFAGVSVGLP